MKKWNFRPSAFLRRKDIWWILLKVCIIVAAVTVTILYFTEHDSQKGKIIKGVITALTFIAVLFRDFVIGIYDEF